MQYQRPVSGQIPGKFGVLSATVGATLLHYFKNICNCWIIFCFMVGRHHATTLYVKRPLIHIIYTRIMTKVNVSATVGMSATVGEMVATVGGMSATVGECPRQWGTCPRQWGKCPRQLGKCPRQWGN